MMLPEADSLKALSEQEEINKHRKRLTLFREAHSTCDLRPNNYPLTIQNATPVI